MRITRHERRYPQQPVEERVGVLGRFPDWRNNRRVLLLPLLLILALLVYLYAQSRWIATYGRVMGMEINISATAISRIDAIHVSLGDEVKAGELLVTLNRFSRDADLYEARMALERQRIELEGLVSRGVAPVYAKELADAEHALEQQHLKLTTARANYWRRAKARDNAREELEAKRGLLSIDGITGHELRLAEQAAEDIQGQVNVAHGLMKEQEAAVKRAEQALAQAEKNLRYAQSKLASDIELRKLEVARLEQVVADGSAVAADRDILAPADGRVSWVNRYAGEVVDHNDVIMNVTAKEPRWVEAYVYAGDLRKIQPGTRADVRMAHAGGSWMEGCVILSSPTQRPSDEEYPVGQRVARSPRRLDENVQPVVIQFRDRIPVEQLPGYIVDVKIARGGVLDAAGCRNSPSENIPVD